MVANLDYFTVVKTEVVTPKNDVWPRCDECDYKPGVRNNEASQRREI